MMYYGFRDWQAWLTHQIATTAEAAFRDMCRQPEVPLFLWFRASESDRIGKKPGELGHGNAMPNRFGKWEMATAERMPINSTLDMLKGWIRERVGSLPILSGGGEE